jgi:hypothetical protein
MERAMDLEQPVQSAIEHGPKTDLKKRKAWAGRGETDYWNSSAGEMRISKNSKNEIQGIRSRLKKKRVD